MFPQQYLQMSVQIAQKIKNGEIAQEKDAIFKWIESHPAFSENKEKVVDCALKLAKYPDPKKAAWDPAYKKSIDKILN